MSILLVVLAALIGSVAGFVAVNRFRWLRRQKKRGLIAALVLGTVLATVGTNASQTLLDLGLEFETVDLIEAVSYFLFGFSATAAWVLLKAAGTRWLQPRWFLIALVPVALFEPMRWAFALIAWSIRRLGS